MWHISRVLDVNSYCTEDDVCGLYATLLVYNDEYKVKKEVLKVVEYTPKTHKEIEKVLNTYDIPKDVDYNIAVNEIEYEKRKGLCGLPYDEYAIKKIIVESVKTALRESDELR